jgi:hypothetical protein
VGAGAGLSRVRSIRPGAGSPTVRDPGASHVTRFLPVPTPALGALTAELEAELAEHRAVARELHAEIVAHCRRLWMLGEEREALAVDHVLGLK